MVQFVNLYVGPLDNSASGEPIRNSSLEIGRGIRREAHQPSPVTPSRRRGPCTAARASQVRCVWFEQGRVQRQINRDPHPAHSTRYRLHRDSVYTTNAIDPVV